MILGCPGVPRVTKNEVAHVQPCQAAREQSLGGPKWSKTVPKWAQIGDPRHDRAYAQKASMLNLTRPIKRAYKAGARPDCGPYVPRP